jgi:hypothetical protein
MPVMNGASHRICGGSEACRSEKGWEVHEQNGGAKKTRPRPFPAPVGYPKGSAGKVRMTDREVEVSR